MEPFGIIKKNDIDDYLEYSLNANAVQFTSFFIECKATHFASSFSKSCSFSLKDVFFAEEDA